MHFQLLPSSLTGILSDAIAFLLSTPQTQYSASDTNAGMATPIKLGYWGPVDASMDWCEPNYAVTPFIAEFWNTISAIPMFTWSLVGWYLCYTAGVKEARFRVLLASLGFIGLGSACFHGTLRFSAQVEPNSDTVMFRLHLTSSFILWITPRPMSLPLCTVSVQLLDELPMMIASYCALFCALEIKNNRPRKEVMVGCVLGMLLQCISYTLFKWYLIFIAGYSLVMLLQMVIIAQHIVQDFKLKRWHSQSFWLALIGLAMIVGSCALWILENAFCEHLGKFKLHAVWHLFGGYGLFLLDLLLIMLRGEYLKKASTVRFAKQVGCHFVEWLDV